MCARATFKIYPFHPLTFNVWNVIWMSTRQGFLVGIKIQELFYV